MEQTAQLRQWGWKLSTTRAKMVTDPIDPKRKMQVGKAPSSYVRIHALLGEKEPWFYAKLEEVGKSGWRCVINWRAPGRDCLLASFMGQTAIAAAKEAEQRLSQYEAQTRLGWVP